MPRMHRTGRRVMAAAACLAVALPMLVARAAPTLTAVTDRTLVTANHRMSEFMVATDPTDSRHLVMAGIDWDDPSGPAGCGIWTSFDGGRTWARSDDPPGLRVPHLRADPWVAFAPDGTVHFTCLHVPGGPLGSLTPDAPGLEKYLRLVHSRSTDGGLTWSEATNVPAYHPNNQRDKEAVFVTASGRVLICANDYSNPANMLVVYRSDDAGATWKPPIRLTLPGGTPIAGGSCNGFAQGPGGTLYFTGFAAGTNGDPLDLDVFVSRDNGDTWRAIKLAPASTPTDARWLAEALTVYPKATWPVVAVNPIDGTAVVAAMLWDYERGRNWTRVWRSTDDGETFDERALPVLPTTTCFECHLASPTIAYDNAGRLGVRAMLFSSDGGLTKEQWLAVSTDNATSWLAPYLVARTDGPAENWTNPLTWTPRNANAVVDANTWLMDHPMDADGVATGWGGLSGGVTHHLRLGGDYWGMTATDEGFVVMWNDHKNGYSQVWSRIVAVE